MIKHNKQGFTVVELMIATVVLSVLVLIASSAIVGLSRLYYKGLNQARAQETVRNVLDEIATGIQFSEDVPIALYDTSGPDNLNNVDAWCIGSKRYTFNVGKKLSDNPGPNEAEWVFNRDGSCDEAVGDCPLVGTYPCNDGTELLGENMRIIEFSIRSQPNGADYDSSSQFNQDSQVYSVVIRVGIGEDDLFCTAAVADSCSQGAPLLTPEEIVDNAATLNCKNGPDSQFCATATSEITVVKRL